MCSPPVDQQQRSKDHNTNSERRADGTYREAANAGQTAPQARCNLQTTGPHTGQNEDEVRKTGEEGGRCCITQKPGQVPARATDGQQMYWTGAFSAILRPTCWVAWRAPSQARPPVQATEQPFVSRILACRYSVSIGYSSQLSYIVVWVRVQVDSTVVAVSCIAF